MVGKADLSGVAETGTADLSQTDDLSNDIRFDLVLRL
jgi:hypothetical protein